jgi:branched-chain amino acid transport system substrate-binding protein
MNMKIPFKPFLWICIACMFFLHACKDENNELVEKFQIGVLLPLTGAASSSGESANAAIDIALRDLNQFLVTTDKSLEAELLIRDTGSHPDTALQKLKDLHAAGIKYIIGPYTSANAEAVLSYANENGIVLLSPSSVATTLAIPGDNLYRLIPSDRSQAEAIAALFLHDSVRTVIPIVRNDVWGVGLLSDANNILSAKGINMENAIMYDPANFNSADIASQVAALIDVTNDLVPDSNIAVYLLSFAEGTEILRAASMVPGDSLVNWYGSSAFANNSSLLLDDVAREFARAQHFRSPSFAPDSSIVDKWGPVNQEIRSVIGREPEVFALTTYDAVWVMGLSYAQALNPHDLNQFKSSLEHLAGFYNGITGTTTLDENGDRKFASFNFWGIDNSGSQYVWKSLGYYNHEDGEVVIFNP